MGPNTCCHLKNISPSAAKCFRNEVSKISKFHWYCYIIHSALQPLMIHGSEKLENILNCILPQPSYHWDWFSFFGRYQQLCSHFSSQMSHFCVFFIRVREWNHMLSSILLVQYTLLFQFCIISPLHTANIWYISKHSIFSDVLWRFWNSPWYAVLIRTI